MKKLILILGYVFLALLVSAALGSLLLFLEGKRLDRESKVFADSAVTAIVAQWDVAELKQRASAEFDSAVDYDEIQEYLDSLRSLGKFQSYPGSSGQATITLSPRYGYEITADYLGTAYFEEGTAEVQMILIRLEGQWQILDFKVTPQEYTEDRTVI